ncbi:MAG: hypothetical protein HRU18_03565 [Pseudoalteromonas sp.]|uniref:hypothetical protein n=1 Tax=Pseudoalteromonas sp. TaxID=53249 RepID=UPI001DF38657|nr:hypothetical protein [Pseudoalteromonas sp.]NRA77264.1 hypothetical protein [Pseudoalteromonas sp.]
MRGDIRKISVGKGHPDDMMHYQVGKVYNLSGREYILSSILLDMDLLEKGKLAFNVYISSRGKGTLLWKTVVDVPVIVENNINFE